MYSGQQAATAAGVQARRIQPRHLQQALPAPPPCRLLTIEFIDLVFFELLS